jgi:hypothetical protein
MINAVANSSYKQTIISSIKPVLPSAANLDNDDIEVRLPATSHFATSVIKPLKDQVIPTIEEVYYCVRKGLVNKKELILYKLVLDYNEALFNDQRTSIAKAHDILVPCSLRFYKNLSELEVKALLLKMEQINQRIAPKLRALQEYTYSAASESSEKTLASPESF